MTGRAAGPAGQAAGHAGRPAGHPAGGPPAASRQLPPRLGEFWLTLEAFQGLIFNLKEVGTQVRHTVNQMKEIRDKTGLRFDWSEFSKLGSRKRSKS